MTQDGNSPAADEQARSIVTSWIASFNAAESAEAVADLFLADSYWRDLVACTWSVRTFHGPDAIGKSLGSLPDDLVPAPLALETDSACEVMDRPGGWGTSIEAFVRFDTAFARGRGHIRLRHDQDSGSWRAWTFLTSIDSFQGWEDRVGHRRPSGHEGISAETSWPERRHAARSYGDHEPAVVVVGAGHSGLSVAARLAVTGVDTLILERNQRVGDNWRNRYRSLYLHNEVWTNHLPYVPFPETWPIFTSKDKIADWLDTYATTLDLNVWSRSTIEQAEYDESSGRWRLTVHTPGERRIVRPRHLILATGVFGDARQLPLEGAATFQGDIVRSQDYVFDSEAADKHVLVIGTGSSAHDIARDYAEHGADVTMLQRSSTTVVSVHPGAQLTHANYREGGQPIADLDLAAAATPLPLARKFHTEVYKRIAEVDAELIAGLNRAGFRTDYGADDSGHLIKYFERGGGYYIDVGCSQLIVDGTIKIKGGVEVDHLERHHVVFTDGTRLKADTIIVAIGFDNMQEKIRQMLGPDVANRVGPVWGIDGDGEIRAMWRPTGQEGLWITGGSFVQSRLMSKVLSQQIIARESGMPIDSGKLL
jgi:cation diffusion facilitator CzcD-associated flavoprotein CzcO